MRIYGIIVIVFGLLAGSLHADTVVLNPIQDSTIYQDNVGNSNGGGEFFFAGQNGGASPRRGLIQFDLSAIPAGSVITGVTFDLFASQVSSPDDVDVSFHRLTSAWGESPDSNPGGGEGGGTAAATGDATWNHTFFDDQLWTTQGGDFIADASATTTVSTTGAYSWSGAGLIDDVQGWLDGSISNYGWIGIGDETVAATAKRFNSRTNGSNVPTLTVQFSAIPEPGSACLVSVLTLGLISRRRR